MTTNTPTNVIPFRRPAERQQLDREERGVKVKAFTVDGASGTAIYREGGILESLLADISDPTDLGIDEDGIPL